MKSQSKKWKAPIFVFSIFCVFILVLFARYAYLALSPTIYGINMSEFAANRNINSTTLYARRGTIFDREGNTLALDITSYTVIAYLSETRTGSLRTPQHVVDKMKTAEALSPLINMEVEAIYDLLNREAYQVELGPGGRGITERVKVRIEELNLPGIDFDENFRRFYPNGNFASYIVGYARRQDVQVEDEYGNQSTINQLVGELGIESKFDEILRGINGHRSFQQDRFGFRIPDTPEDNVPAIKGQDIYLTIDANIQRIMEATISDAQDRYRPEWMTISVMDAKTGDILGAVSTPSFNPNILDITNYENPLTSFVYEPGSIMKTYTYMCAIDKGTYVGTDTFLSGRINFGGSTVRDWNDWGWGTITFDYGFQQSSNVGIVNMIRNERFLTRGDLRDCFRNYGFGQLTGVNLPRELPGRATFTHDIEVAAAGFGQGISTTPIQHLQALTLLSNNGRMLRPNIVSKIVDSNTGEVIYEREIHESEQILKQSTIDEMKKLMYNVVHDRENGATGLRYRVEGLDVIGKTGTAQIFNNAAGQYFDGWNDFIYSFHGMFPKEDPKIIIMASMSRPNTGSGATLASITQPIMLDIAKHLGLIEGLGRGDMATTYVVNNYTNRDVAETKKYLEDKGIRPLVLGDGDRIINQFPRAGSTIITGDRVFLLTNGNNIRMPNLRDWSRLEAISLLRLIGLEYNIEGFGRIVSQSIPSNSIINFDNVLELRLERKRIFIVEDDEEEEEE